MTERLVESTNLTKRYGPRAAVDHVGLQVRRGEVYGFLGPNGAGKTTTPRRLLGLVGASSGTACVLGRAPGDPAALARKEKTMNAHSTLSGPRAATVAGLVVGAVGIAILWASEVEFPFYPPPGILILLAGAIFVALAPWPWAPAVGAFLGLFVTVGFVVSGGPPNLLGEDGRVGVLIGTWIQLIGVLTALIAGVIATRADYRKPAKAR